MKKETVIRENRCDRELGVILFGCFFLFMILQIPMSETKDTIWMERFTRVLYITAVSGFSFLLGYNWRRYAKEHSAEETKRWTLNATICCWIVYLFLAGGQTIVMQRLPLKRSAADIITAVMVPSMAVPFFSLAVMMFLIWIFDKTVHSLAAHRKLTILAMIFVLTTSFLKTEQDGYAFVKAMFGQNQLVSVPAVPYFAYFLLGNWFEKRKPGFQWKILGTAAAVSMMSVLLYHSGLQKLCVVTISFLPVYLFYAFAEEILTEITLRVQIVKWGSDLTELVFLIAALLLFVIGRKNMLAQSSLAKLMAAAILLILLIYAAFAGLWMFAKGYEVLENRMQMHVKHKKTAYFIIFTIAFAAILFLTFFEFWRTGKTFIIKGDGIAQYYPRAVYFSRYIRELCSNLISGKFELPMYDFHVGMGTEVTYSLEPLYFLFALFDEEHMEFAYNLVTVLRFYLSGITMSVLCLYFKKNYFASFLASVVYVVCGFALYGGTMHTMFMIPMIMLPLQIIAIEEILRKKRWYLCTIFTAVALLSNYYYLYMNTIAMGIYFMVRFFCTYRKEKRNVQRFLGRAMVISGSYLLGVAMSCIVLVTTFGMYLGSDRGSGTLIKTSSLFYYSKEWLMNCFMTFLTTANSPGEWLKLGFLPIALFAVLILFLRKERRELKIFSVLAVCFMAFPIAGFIFSGFSAVINRWCYMVSLLVAFIVAECFDDLRNMKTKELISGIGITVVYTFLAYFGTYKSTRYTKYAAILLCLTLIAVFISQTYVKWISEAMKKSVLLILTVAIVFYQGYSLFHIDGRVRGYADRGETQNEVTNTPLGVLSEIEDDNFYRAVELKPNYNAYNASYLLNFCGTTLLSSTLNGYMTEYLGDMGCTSYTMIRTNGLNNRAFLNSLASVKYLAYYEDVTGNIPFGYEPVLETAMGERNVILCENKYALPLGYTYEEKITEEELAAYPVAERQEILMQKIMIHSDEENADKQSEKSDITITAKPLSIVEINEQGIELHEHAMTAVENEKEAYSVKVDFEQTRDAEIYLVLKQAFLEGDMSEESIKITVKTESNKVSYDFRPDDYRYGSGQEDYIINLGYYEDVVDSCTITMNRAGLIQFESLQIYSQPMDNLADYTNNMTEDILENVEIGINRVTGTISLDKEKILALSIPYQKGWTAFVDGEQVQLYRANGMYMAIPLTKGEHEIVLTFEIPGVQIALRLMAGSTVLFLVLCTLDQIRRRKRNG